MTVTPSIYVACLASYNAGMLHGEWIDLDGSEDVRERISEILEQSPEENAEEWAVHDHEYCGGLSEYPGLDALENIQETFVQAERENVDWELVQEFCDATNCDLEPDVTSAFNDAYVGSASSLVDWCYGYLEDTGMLQSIPENLRYYFNYEAFARDMEMSDVFTIEYGGETHVFYNI